MHFEGFVVLFLCLSFYLFLFGERTFVHLGAVD